MVLHDSLWSKVIENSATHIRINTQWLEAEPRFMNILVAIPVCVCVVGGGGGNSNGKLATYLLLRLVVSVGSFVRACVRAKTETEAACARSRMHH